MTLECFENIFKEQIRLCETVLLDKSKEYVRNEDRLWNFKVAARIGECTPERALWGMFLKHIASLSDIVDDIKKRDTFVTKEHLNEKVTDSINYLILLKACLIDTNMIEDKNLGREEK